MALEISKTQNVLDTFTASLYKSTHSPPLRKIVGRRHVVTSITSRPLCRALPYMYYNQTAGVLSRQMQIISKQSRYSCSLGRHLKAAEQQSRSKITHSLYETLLLPNLFQPRRQRINDVIHCLFSTAQRRKNEIRAGRKIKNKSCY